jgi:hypothetical protein
MKGIRISCNKKRELFTQYRRNTDNIQARSYYKNYCTILRKVIKEAKKEFYHKQVASSSNKVKTAWRIIKENLGNPQHADSIHKIKCGNVLLKKPNDIANAFNRYYTNIT